ncbi:hypothetical protein N431DRAFT_31544 [Stipitochalara longipes BDJ]|nr:hypothetical protein N431DRAFT_31544 [Stipitochalara longipes BDJ]
MCYRPSAVTRGGGNCRIYFLGPRLRPIKVSRSYSNKVIGLLISLFFCSQFFGSWA